MRSRKVVVGAVCLAALATLVSPSRAQTGTQTKKVRVALQGYENNMTPFTLTFGSLPNTHDLINLIYDTLFWSQVKEEPEPWLAESAVSSDGGRLWTVTLRQGVTWHDGKPFTADDVKFSFDYYLKTPGASGRYAHHVSDAPPFDRAEVVDARTLRVYFKTPAPQFKILPGADLPIVPKHVWESVTEPTRAATDPPIGTGPFRVVEMVPDQRYRLVANTTYFKGKPTVDELELPIIKDVAPAFTALRTGEVDMVARNLPPELSAEFANVSGLRVIQGTKFESSQIYFNARKAPLTDARLRKAISLAVDNKVIVDTVLLGKGQPGLDSFIHPQSPWALPGARHEYDVGKAQRLLDEAGYTAKDPDGVRKAPNGTRLEFSILVSSFEPADIRAAQLVGQQVAPLGVRLNTESLDPATLRARRTAPAGELPTYDAYISVLETHAHVDPDGLYYFFHSPGPKGFGASITGYGNARVDQLSEQAVGTEIAARKPLLHEIQRILAEEAPVLMLWYRNGEYAVRPGAYDGWVSDLGHGIFTKRSFLPEYVNAAKAAGQPVAGTADDGSSAGGVIAVLAIVAVGGVGAFVLTGRRRRAETVEQ